MSVPRLRRTFAYPTDEIPEALELDEEEQETLITTLKQENESRNAQFRLILFSLPVLSTIPYLLTLFTTRGSPLPSLLALTSLASTTWLLHFLPAEETGIAVLDGGAAPRKRRMARSPLETWLPFLNLGLCGVLVLIGILPAGRRGSGVVRGGSVVVDLLPAVVYAVVLVAKMVMAGVDPERELGGLRYRYKGA